MSYPSEVPTVLSGYDFGNSARSCPGFEFSGNQYLFVRQGGGGTPTGDLGVHAMKSTDAGLTWTEKDAAHHPDLVAGGTLLAPYTVMRDGATVYLIDATGTVGFPGTPTGLQWWSYNLTTDLWSARSSTASIVPGIMQANELMLDLKKRDTNDYVLFYSGPREGALARVYYATFNGTTFGSAVKLPNQTSATHLRYGVDCSIDSTKTTHFYYFDDNTSPGPGYHLYHVGMDSGGSFGTESVITPAASLIDIPGQFSNSIVFSAGIVEELAIVALTMDSGGFLFNKIFSASAALSPVSWTPQTITANLVITDAGVLVIGKDAALVEFNGTLFCGWTEVGSRFRDLQGGLLLWSSASTGDLSTWTPMQEIFDPNRPFWAPVQIGAYAMTGGVAFVGSSVSQDGLNSDAEVLQFLKLSTSAAVTSANIYRTGTRP